MDDLLKLKKHLLVFFKDDYTGLFHVSSIAERYFKLESNEERKKFVLDYILKLLEEKLIRVGCLLYDGKLDEWKQSPQEIIARINQEWDGSRYESDGLYGTWFGITEQGEEELKRLKAME